MHVAYLRRNDSQRDILAVAKLGSRESDDKRGDKSIIEQKGDAVRRSLKGWRTPLLRKGSDVVMNASCIGPSYAASGP